MKTVSFEQSYWLAGYYDDFHSARAVADDKNPANVRTISHTLSHHGSLYGGENILSPRFSHPFVERLGSGEYAALDPAQHGGSSSNDSWDYAQTGDTKLKMNRGLHEWITVDTANTDGSFTENQPRLLVPTSLASNRQKWNGAGNEGYLRFFNGHDTDGDYYMPTGTIDPTLGGSRSLNYAGSYLTEPIHTGGFARMLRGNLSKEIKHTFFTSIYTGEAPQSSLSFTETRPSKYLFNVKSPAQQQFLVNSIYNDANASATSRILTYDGALRMRGIGEMFHLRIAAHKIGDWTFDNYILKVGYKNTASYTTTSDDFNDTASLATINITLANLGITGALNQWQEGQANASAYNPDSLWADVYVFFNFTNNTWQAYSNDNTTAFATGSIDTNVTMLTAKGWSLDAKWSGAGSHGVVLDTLIDRAALCLPLNWRAGNAEQPPLVHSMDYQSGADSVSSMSITILDDLNDYSLSALTTGSSATEWRLLSFRDDESRPLWSGYLEEIAHAQNSQQHTLETTLTARDSLSVLDRVLPIWETGGNAHFSLNQHISMDAVNTKRAYDTQSLADAMMFGSSALTIGENTLGFNKHDTLPSGLTHQKHSNPRTHLFSGQTIQMYINEDEAGPNNLENQWEGGGVGDTNAGGADNTWSLCEIVGYSSNQGNDKLAFYVKYDASPTITFGSANFTRKTITSYKGLSNSGTIHVKGTNGYDNVSGGHTITSMEVIRNRINGALTSTTSTGAGDMWVKIVTATDMPTGTNDILFETTRIDVLNRLASGGQNYATQQTQQGFTSPAYDNTIAQKHLVDVTTATNHNLSFGDVFVLQDGMMSNTDAGNYYTQTEFKVLASLSATQVRCIIPRIEQAVTNLIASNFNERGQAVDLRKLSAHASPIAHRVPKDLPLLAKRQGNGTGLFDYGSFSSSGDFAKFNTVKHSRVHARWMRDLPLSPFFRAQFGVIDPVPYWRTGIGSATHSVLSPNHIAAFGNSTYNSDGTPTSWNGIRANQHTSGFLDKDTTTIYLDDPAMWWFVKRYNMDDEGFILELLDTETGDSQYCIANGVDTPSSSQNTTWSASTGRFTSASQSMSRGQIVIHEGFDHYDLNGVFQVKEVTSSTQYTVSRLEFEPMINEFSYAKSVAQGGSQWSLGSAHHFNDPDAIKVNRDTIEFAGGTSVQQPPANQTGTLRYNFIEITGVKGIKKQFDITKTIISLRKVDESNGYKHLYVLWADMRNDGTANADGGLRTKDFGVILPTTKNYKVNVALADQFDESGFPDVFTELKIGEDVDIWQFDATTEPYYGTSWSSLHGGSNYESLDDRYHNWENKGGSFLIIDASRFYNLNTAATGGRTGYASGGLVDFGDYVLATKGFPFLTDAYYKSAISSYKTSAGTTIHHHPNSLFMLNDNSIMTQDIALGDTVLYVDDNTQFPTAGTGAIICQKGSNRGQEDLIYYYSWTGKGTDATLGDKLTGVFITSLPNAEDPNTVKTLVASERANYSSPASRATITLKTTTNTAGIFEKVLVFNTPSALFPLRLSVNIEGVVKSQNRGTYYADDKMRSMYSITTADTWARNTTLPCIYEMPKTRYMPDSVGSAQKDSFGSMFDGKGMSIMNIATNIVEKDGNGVDSKQTTFNWLMDRDNILTIRQQIPSNIAFTRANLKQSSMNTRMGAQITNVRVYFNGNSNYAEFPTPTEGATTRWRVLQQPKVFSEAEAMALAKQEFLRESNAQVQISAEVLLQAGEKSKMLSGGRYGYVQDVMRRGYLYHKKANASWTNLWGGMPFNGVQDIAHSAQTLFSHSLTATSLTGAESRADSITVVQAIVENQTTLEAKGIHVHTATGSNTQVGEIIFTISGPSCTAQWNASGAGFGSPVVLQNGFNTIVGNASQRLSIFCDNGFTPHSGIHGVNYQFGNSRSNGIPHYGTNSLTPCLKIIHVDKNTPKLSETTNNELRLAISLHGASGNGRSTNPVSDANTYKLWLLDYRFNETTTGSSGSEKPPEYSVNALAGSASVEITGNGMFEVQLPSSYASIAKKVIFSVDYDYLQSIARTIGGHTSLIYNAHDITGLTTYNSHGFNTTSAFPLGHRIDAGMGKQAELRTAYYAPRLAIVDDINYVPASTVSLTDTHMDLSSETLNIAGITWKKKCQDVDKVQLDLQRTEKHFKYTLAGVFKQLAEDGGGLPNRPPRPEIPPPTIPPVLPLPPMGGGGLIPAQAFNSMGGAGGDPSSMFAGMSANLLGTSTFRGLKGKASFATDVGLSDGSFSVIGQNRPSTALSSNRDIDGIESNMMSSEGVSIPSSDGFVLGGIIDPETGAQGETHSHSINVRVPNDVSAGGFVEVIAQITFEGDSSLSGELTTSVTCAETAATAAQTVIVGGSMNRQSHTLFSTSALNGAEIAGNTLTVKIERSPAQGNDNAGFSSVTTHSLSVKLRRYSNLGVAQSNSMRPY